VTECDRAVCDDYANYVVGYEGEDVRTYCGSCLDEIRDTGTFYGDVLRQL